MAKSRSYDATVCQGVIGRVTMCELLCQPSGGSKGIVWWTSVKLGHRTSSQSPLRGNYIHHFVHILYIMILIASPLFYQHISVLLVRQLICPGLCLLGAGGLLPTHKWWTSSPILAPSQRWLSVIIVQLVVLFHGSQFKGTLSPKKSLTNCIRISTIDGYSHFLAICEVSALVIQ